MEKQIYTPVKSALFSGHRFLSFSKIPILKVKLKSAIKSHYANGVRHFYCGMAVGFDMLAAETALAMKEIYPDIRLTAVIPYRQQAKGWNTQNQERYADILNKADNIVIPSEYYYRGCLLRRNDYMLKNAHHLIAYYDGKQMGGTYYTCKKAEGLGVSTMNLY